MPKIKVSLSSQTRASIEITRHSSVFSWSTQNCDTRVLARHSLPDDTVKLTRPSALGVFARVQETIPIFCGIRNCSYTYITLVPKTALPDAVPKLHISIRQRNPMTTQKIWLTRLKQARPNSIENIKHMQTEQEAAISRKPHPFKNTGTLLSTQQKKNNNKCYGIVPRGHSGVLCASTTHDFPDDEQPFAFKIDRPFADIAHTNQH